MEEVECGNCEQLNLKDGHTATKINIRLVSLQLCPCVSVGAASLAHGNADGGKKG